MTKKLRLITLLLLATNCIVFGQDITLKGKIKDSMTKNNLVAATIGIENTTIGTFSNEDGVFELQIPQKYTKHNIIFSYIGYKTKISIVSELSQTQVNNIFLEPSMLNLNEIIVKDTKTKIPKPQEIINKVIQNIVKNYPQKPYNQNFFYREYLTNGDSCKKLTYADLNIYDTKAYQKIQEDYTKPIKSGINLKIEALHYSKDFSKFNKINGLVNTSFINQQNWLRNRKFLFDEKNLQDFKLVLSLFTIYENNYVYEIDFSIQEIAKYENLKGKIWVNENDFALVKMVFEYDLAFVPFGEQQGENYDTYHHIIETILFGKKQDVYFLTYQSLDTKITFQDLKTNENITEQSHFELYNQSINLENPEKFETSLAIPKNESSKNVDNFLRIVSSEKDKKWFETLNKK
jgi:hypothetical protein